MSTTDNSRQTIPRLADDGLRPLSYPQQRLFLLDRIMPGLPAYNVPTLVQVGTTLDAGRLKQALNATAGRHQILRSTIRLIDGEPVQEVSPLSDVELSVSDLRSVAPGAREAQAEALLGRFARRPFDLASDLLLRAALVHLAPEQDLLLIVFHHIGSDHVSSAILFRELDELYGALGDGREPALPQLPIQYADFAAWQREHLSGSQYDELVDYWTSRLAGAPERLDLPSDRPRPSIQSYRGKLREFTLEAELANPLRELARRNSASIFVLLMAAFKTLLHRYAGVEDIVVGAPASGRHYEEVTHLLGCFSNTLALRTDLSGDPTFAELLSRVKETSMEAQIFQELPFEKVVEALNPERAQSHSPVFQVLLGYDVAPAQPPELAGRPLQRLPVPGWEWSRFDLSIILRDLDDGALRGELEYTTDLFDSSTIERFIGHYRTLLEGVLRDPQQRISELPLLTAREREQVMVQWNDTARPYDMRCLHELFAEQAARVRGAIAVADGTHTITYAELERRANQLARELTRLGAGPGQLVGICLDRSVELVVALLGVLKSGAAYVPLEPTYPPERQEFILTDAQAPVLITQERYLGAVDLHGAKVLCVDRDAARVEEQSGDPLPPDGDPEQPAYVIYTSGSTGRPKGVEIAHRSVANLIAHMRERPGLTDRDVVANLTTPAFDLSVPDWYLPLSTGARLVIVPREATLDGVDLADWLARTGATFVQATPTTWQLLVDAGWNGRVALKIVCGGEALPATLAEELRARGELWHMYGPTETTVWSSIHPLRPGDGPPVLGGPIANTTFFVLDPAGQPVPIGVPGELHIGGDGLAVGYRERPELTAEKFVHTGPAGAGRLYRTGDLARWRRDGTLEFHGRIDHQIKLRGFRIELEEIEAVLEADAQVSGAAVVVREDTPADQRIVAYIVPADGRTLEVEVLRRLCKAKLAPYMVPSTFVELEKFPTTPNRKLDRQALPAPDGARPDLADSYVAPETPIEETLTSIWSEVLGVDRVGIDDDFFDLGGHSLLAVKMLARVQETMGIDLYLGIVFENSTVRELAVAVTSGLLEEAGEDELADLLAEAEASEL
ncbi:MAG: amino acid adenylation domain-containing protein [Actinomycetota bacterium]|nr:amino acid adenylation domain-containing protein [Actinomycetota bacterium]